MWSADAADLKTTLQGIIDADAAQDNVSYSFAIQSEQLGSIAVAAGTDDHATGTEVNADSLYPAGSVAKAYTAVAAMRLAEKGVLDLDAPVAPIVDPWLSTQSLPTISKLWGNNTQIATVTSRQLLSMQAGFGDYEDQPLLNWTIANPSNDYLPMDFLESLDKTFLFEPGTGGAYSSDGFVLMGMVLAASTGAKDWQNFDQLAALGPSAASLNNTLFLHTGTCAQAERNVVHQYAKKPYYKPKPDPGPTPPPTPAGGGSYTCATANFPGYKLEGPVMKVAPDVNQTACCTLTHALGACCWSWTTDAKQEAAGAAARGNCTVFNDPGDISGQISGDSVSGLPKPPPLTRDSFHDLYPDSCLNGWTMGNLATSASDVARFYHLLGTGQLVSASSWAQMQAFKPLTQGFAKGAGYGLGLIDIPPHIKDATGRTVNWTDSVGHPGQDWGSSIGELGWYPNLNASMALATNTAGPMNFTNGTETVGIGGVFCDLVNAVVQHLHPGEPKLECRPEREVLPPRRWDWDGRARFK